MLEIRLLGELEVKRDGHAVPLPASRKTRALLAYLAATAKPHLRERLCELLWDGPDDPRAALRWSVAKLRPLVDPHLVASRDHLQFYGTDAWVDIQRICTPGAATTDALEACASLHRGEFLEGLDLPACFRFQQWCLGERERFRKSHIAVLAELVQRYGTSEAALPHARKRIDVDPFNEAAHASLIRLLASLGLGAEAMQQYEHCCSVFERELNTRPGAAVEDARRLIGKPTAPPAAGFETPAIAGRFVGRLREIERIESATRPVIIIGEPGIGKSRLIAEVRSRVKGATLYARAFAAEMIRPYGVWSDALGELPSETDRARLFDAVLRMLDGVELIAIDDVQWIDEASAALLHYVARKSGRKIVLAARVGEIDDNTHAKRLVTDLRAEEIALGPLSASEVRALVHDEAAAQRSGGNPLFALELARARGDDASEAMSAVIAHRLRILDSAALEVASWAAAVGHEFDAEIVGRATGMSAGEMLAALGKLERSAIIRAAGDSTYDFTHDLVRDAAYQLVSGPRRRILHRHIARALREAHDADGALAGEVMHHAALAGDYEDAAQAAVAAGQRCLRLFAYVDAMSVARRGLQMTASMSVQMELYHVIVLARRPTAERLPFAGAITELTDAARRAGLHATAALGAHLMACFHEETNDYERAADAASRSIELSRGDRDAEALYIADTARCLLLLQRDIDRAEALVAEAEAYGVTNGDLVLAHGFLHAHRGRPAEAIPYLEEALLIAADARDHWREWLALSRLTTLALEERDYESALRHCARLRPVTEKMNGGSESTRTDVMECVARYASGEQVDIDAALQQLRDIDSKSDLAWTLAYLAEIDTDRDRARQFAQEALDAAEVVGRQSDAVIARCILGLPASASPDINARAKNFLEEQSHGRTGTRAEV